MDHRLYDLKSAAAHLHMDENDLRHFAQRGELESVRRGEDFLFEHCVLDEWAQRRLIALPGRQLSGEHRHAMDERRRSSGDVMRVSELISPRQVAAFLSSKTRAGVLRDMTDFADSTGLLYDPETLFVSLQSREEIASTAVPGGVAFLHPRYHDPYLFAETFLALGRTTRPVFFGSPDGEGTDLFFLLCSTDHSLHLHILARLCLLSRDAALLAELRGAPDGAAMLAALASAENAFLERTEHGRSP